MTWPVFTWLSPSANLRKVVCSGSSGNCAIACRNYCTFALPSPSWSAHSPCPVSVGRLPAACNPSVRAWWRPKSVPPALRWSHTDGQAACGSWSRIVLCVLRNMLFVRSPAEAAPCAPTTLMVAAREVIFHGQRSIPYGDTDELVSEQPTAFTILQETRAVFASALAAETAQMKATTRARPATRAAPQG